VSGTPKSTSSVQVGSPARNVEYLDGRVDSPPVGMLSSARNVLWKAFRTANASWINRAMVAGGVVFVIVAAFALIRLDALVFQVFGTALTLYFVVLVMLKNNFEIRAATRDQIEVLQNASQQQIQTLKEEFARVLAALQNVVNELSRLAPPGGLSAGAEAGKAVAPPKPGPPPTLLTRPPPDSTKWLFNEAVRQETGFIDTKNSLDTRAAYMLGLLGIILTIFSTAFVAYWTSTAPTELLLTQPLAVWLSLLLTLGVLVALFSAIVLEIWVLLPRDYGGGIDLMSAYAASVNPRYDVTKIEEGSLRVLIPSMASNLIAYSRSIPRYTIGALFTVVSLSLAIEFVALVVATSIGLDSRLQSLVMLFLIVAAVVLVAVTTRKSQLTLRGSRDWTRSQNQRLREFDELQARMRTGSK